MFWAACVAFLTITSLEFGKTQLQKIKIGALFLDHEIDTEISFQMAIEDVNLHLNENFILMPLVRRLADEGGSIALEEEACDLINNGVIAIFGPSSRGESGVVAQICSTVGIPHILFDIANEVDSGEKATRYMTVNLFPNQHILSMAYADIVHNFSWRRFTIAYCDDDVMYILQRSTAMHENTCSFYFGNMPDLTIFRVPQSKAVFQKPEQ